MKSIPLQHVKTVFKSEERSHGAPEPTHCGPTATGGSGSAPVPNWDPELGRKQIKQELNVPC